MTRQEFDNLKTGMRIRSNVDMSTCRRKGDIVVIQEVYKCPEYTEITYNSPIDGEACSSDEPSSWDRVSTLLNKLKD